MINEETRSGIMFRNELVFSMKSLHVMSIRIVEIKLHLYLIYGCQCLRYKNSNNDESVMYYFTYLVADYHIGFSLGEKKGHNFRMT